MHSTPAISQSVTSAAEAMLVASRALVGVAARSMAGLDDVTLPQYRALVVLSGEDAVTVRVLAEALDVHPSTATRLCDRLVKKRLISRRPGASGDRRETALTLTAKGRRLVARVVELRRRDLLAIAARMSPADRRHALLGLRALAQAAGERAGSDSFAWLAGSGVGDVGPEHR